MQMDVKTMVLRAAAAFALLLCGPVVFAQEVRYVDLTAVEQRTDLRYPPATAAAQSGTGGGSGTAAVSDAVPDAHDPHALGVFLTHHTATQIDPSQPFQVEFKVVNTGKAPIAVPVSPNLSDLQPADDSVRFHYLSMALSLSVLEDPRSGASIQLYGTPHREQTLVMLQPGEWIRVTAQVKLSAPPETADSAKLIGGFALRENTYYPHPGGAFTDVQNLYPNATRTPPLTVFWMGPTTSPSSPEEQK